MTISTMVAGIFCTGHDESQDHCHNGSVEHQTCEAIGIKPGAFRIVSFDAVDDVHNHSHQDQEHTEDRLLR